MAVRKLIHDLGRWRAALIAALILTVLSAAFSVCGPKVVGNAITALAEGLMQKHTGTGEIALDGIAKLLLFALGLYLCSVVCLSAQRMLMAELARKVCYRLRSEISQKLGRLPMRYFEGKPYGEFLSRAMSDVDMLGRGISQGVVQTVTDIATLLGTLVMMLSILAFWNVIAVGEILALILYVKNMTGAMRAMQLADQLRSMEAAAERIFEFLGEEEEKAAANPAQLMNVGGCVEFTHVSFGYHPGVPVIKDFSAAVIPGQKIAIVGPSGAGKTTLIKLLMRFYEVDSGTIRVDGCEIRDCDAVELRNAFGVVSQDAWLFEGTIMENIRYGRPEATDEEVIAAAKTAYAHAFIQRLPGAYQRVISADADELSPGQRQLLALARTILADRRILIFDEGTSAVDARTELRVQRAIDKFMQGRTSFIITQRLSAIKNADLILVMRDGLIVEQGNHGDLMRADGFYAECYRSQFVSQSLANEL